MKDPVCRPAFLPMTDLLSCTYKPANWSQVMSPNSNKNEKNLSQCLRASVLGTGGEAVGMEYRNWGEKNTNLIALAPDSMPHWTE